jgi:hypothetical protein
MQARHEGAYCAKVLHQARHILNDTLRAALARAEASQGVPMKITDIQLRAVVGDPREVYDVYLTMEPVTPGPSPAQETTHASL